VAIAAGSNFSCRTSPDGTACWGTSDALISTGALVFSKIEAGSSHSCGILPSDGVLCWGNNADGQLGDAGAVSMHEIPELRAGLVTAGASHTCALSLAGELFCWGRDTNGAVSGTPSTIVLPPTRVQPR
jgi:alpha-tubulin suppressor-like RCC1 family protein